MYKTIGIEEAEKAYHYIAQTDEAIAQAKARLMAAEYGVKTAEAVCYLDATGTVEERKSVARCAPRYTEAVSEHEDAVLEFETIKAKRQRALLAIELYRTQEASRRAGT